MPNEVRHISTGQLLWLFFLAFLFAGSAASTAGYFSQAAEGRSQAAAVAAAADPFADISLEAKSAYVFDLAQNRELYALNPDAQLPLASLTKVPLALVVAEVVPPEELLTMPRSVPPLDAGEKWRAQDVLTFMLVESSNAAADVLSRIAGERIANTRPEAAGEDAALRRMNDLMRSLDLNHTYFLNVTGLDLSDTQAGAFGTAREVAALFGYAARVHPALFSGTTRGTVSLISGSGERIVAENTDKALGAIPSLLMGKTGTTDLAGGNLAVVFEAGPSHPVAIVVMGSSEEGRFDDMRTLVRATLDAVALQ